MKGPDAYMNNLLNVLLKFRENSVGIVGDIRKMYNSVYIKNPDQHVHRFLWRDLLINQKPNIYVITAVNIGDRPIGTIATVALRKTAEMGRGSYPKEADVLLETTYVDDIVDSVGSMKEALTVTENISILLKPGNVHIKGWSISGDQKPIVNIYDKDLQKVLGLSWKPSLDTIQFEIRLNFSKKVKKSTNGPRLS